MILIIMREHRLIGSHHFEVAIEGNAITLRAVKQFVDLALLEDVESDDFALHFLSWESIKLTIID